MLSGAGDVGDGRVGIPWGRGGAVGLGKSDF